MHMDRLKCTPRDTAPLDRTWRDAIARWAMQLRRQTYDAQDVLCILLISVVSVVVHFIKPFIGRAV